MVHSSIEQEIASETVTLPPEWVGSLCIDIDVAGRNTFVLPVFACSDEATQCSTIEVRQNEIDIRPSSFGDQ